MILHSLQQLDDRRLRFLFVLVARFAEKQEQVGDAAQAGFWRTVADAVEDEREADPPEDLNLDFLLDADAVMATQVCKGLADAEFPASTEFFRELTGLLETECRRRHLEVIDLEELARL